MFNSIVEVKGIGNIIFVLSGLIPASILCFLCILILITIPQTFAVVLAFMGIVGYAGMVLLLFERRINKLLLLGLLCIGMGAIVILISDSGVTGWMSFLDFREPMVSLLFLWPLVVGGVNAIRLFMEITKEDDEKS